MEIIKRIYPVTTWESLSDPNYFNWRVEPKKRFPWLQRLCFWTLEKLGCRYPVETMQRVTIDIEGLLPAITAQYLYLQRRRAGTEYGGYIVICSHKEWNNASDEIMEISLLDFRGLQDWKVRYPHLNFRGLTIVLVPWYTGAPLLMPRGLYQTQPIG